MGVFSKSAAALTSIERAELTKLEEQVTTGVKAFAIAGRPLRAHRMAYEVAKGDIPEGMHILHSCDNPKCCNPAHLRPGTHQENMDDMQARGRRTSTYWQRQTSI